MVKNHMLLHFCFHMYLTQEQGKQQVVSQSRENVQRYQSRIWQDQGIGLPAAEVFSCPTGHRVNLCRLTIDLYVIFGFTYLLII